MKQQIIKILKKHRVMVFPTNRSGGDYAVATEVNNILDEVIKEIKKLKEDTKIINSKKLTLIRGPGGEHKDLFKCKDCKHTLVRTRSRGMYCGICKK